MCIYVLARGRGQNGAHSAHVVKLQVEPKQKGARNIRNQSSEGFRADLRHIGREERPRAET